jgi:PTS system ascorbate-specific IIB component
MSKPKIYFICGAGLGSSLACQMVAEDVFAEKGLEVDSDHEAISSAPGLRADIIVSAENFKVQFDKFEMDPKIKFVFLHNIVDKNEIAEKLVPVVEEWQA